MRTKEGCIALVARKTYDAAMFMTEAAWQAQIEQVAALLGWLTFHPYDSRRSREGWPDLVCSRPPRLLFLECKRERGQPTAEQYDWLERLRASGQEAFCVWPSQWDFVAQLLEGSPMTP